jgi:uncharacterized protein (TIGR00369 family)
MSAPAPPDGFVRHDRASPLTEPWEPIFARRRDGVVELGLWIDTPHCNRRGMPHGGLIAALADNAMGLSLVLADPEAAGGGAVTVSLNVDYMATGAKGQWLQVTPRVLKAGRSMGFVEALVTCDDTPVARANATFRVLPAGPVRGAEGGG